MQNITYYIKNPKDILTGIITHTPYLWPDKLYLQLLFRLKMGNKLDLDNPQTFNEKLQWLKLYNRNPEYTRMVDKIEAKKWAAERIGKEHIIPTLGVWNRPEDIDFDSLPDQFVLKTNHDSGGIVICKDKSKLDIKNAIKKLNKSLKSDYFLVGREWPYKNVPRKVFAEKYLFNTSKPNQPLQDYKFFCFDGVMTFMLISNERGISSTKFDYFDKCFNHLPFTQGGDNFQGSISLPQNFNLMINFAEKLSTGIPHVRVDLYDINHEIYFGEMTFFDSSGFAPFDPQEWDHKFGCLINLPVKS